MRRIYDDTLLLLSNLRPFIERIDRRDRDLGRQLRRAATSIVLNLAEGTGQHGGHGRERYRSALGSALEVRACLDAGRALGYVPGMPPTVHDRPDEIVWTLYRVTQ